MRNRILFIFFLAGFLGFTSCLGPLTEKDNGRTIELSEDSPFTIQLKSPTKDAYWKLMQYDNTVVKQLGEVKIVSDGEGKVFEFDFQAIASGSTSVLIAYLHEDEPSIVQETFEVKVICGTMGRIEAE